MYITKGGHPWAFKSFSQDSEQSLLVCSLMALVALSSCRCLCCDSNGLSSHPSMKLGRTQLFLLWWWWWWDFFPRFWSLGKAQAGLTFAVIGHAQLRMDFSLNPLRSLLLLRQSGTWTTVVFFGLFENILLFGTKEIILSGIQVLHSVYLTDL